MPGYLFGWGRAANARGVPMQALGKPVPDRARPNRSPSREYDIPS